MFSLLWTVGGQLVLESCTVRGPSCQCRHHHTEVVRTLLSAGAKVDLQRGCGVSPLHVACRDGHTEVVRAQLSGGAKVDLLTKEGDSPLHTACHYGHIGVVRALLSAGAREDLRDINGMTPLDLSHPPCALRAEVERLLQQAKVERDSARADESRVGAPSAPAVVLPPPHYQPASQLQAASEGGGEAPPRVLVGCRLRPATSAARLRPGVCAPCAGARHQLHLVVWPSSRPVGTACPCVTAHKSVKISTGGRVATRRHAHSCGRRGRRGWA